MKNCSVDSETFYLFHHLELNFEFLSWWWKTVYELWTLSTYIKFYNVFILNFMIILMNISKFRCVENIRKKIEMNYESKVFSELFILFRYCRKWIHKFNILFFHLHHFASFHYHHHVIFISHHYFSPFFISSSLTVSSQWTSSQFSHPHLLYRQHLSLPHSFSYTDDIKMIYYWANKVFSM